jgi:hypothetical protein
MKKATATKTRQPAEVLISVTKFRDVLGATAAASRSGRQTDYRMRMKNEHPHVCVEGDRVCVMRPGAPIRFTVDAADGEQEKYFPVGITFVRGDSGGEGDEQRLGLLNFLQKNTHAKGRSLSIVDSYQDSAKGTRYKFSVIVQRGSDGKIGIIDPDIIHEDD